MKSILAITLAVVFAVSLGAALASNLQGSNKQDMQMSRPAQQTAAVSQNACRSKYPSFSRLDSKHQGYITKEEARHVHGLLQAFKKADTDHNGKLEQAEYSAWVQSKCSNKHWQSQGRMTPPPV
ncbi:MAG: EF-hand domain-containing protein [Gammaproteobacteria bacterium]